ncbi:helix-turn-helix transcriptional regulator [Actinoplanes sp. CA-030573]|uniref:helix-turn-helix transcriptional regulator n=1 Tax=Actinoplanes sp. CA-030573 TaxID=3239898 RepID=UPI003D89EA58
MALPDLLGPRAVELRDRLIAVRADRNAGWAARFSLLDTLLGRWMADAEPAGPVMAGWHRLQQAGGRIRVGDLAGELGTPRRKLERAFRQRLGQTPGEVARIARFQRAITLIDRGEPLARVAAESGFADQPHLTRETRALAGATPAELRAIVQDRPGRPQLASRA